MQSYFVEKISQHRVRRNFFKFLLTLPLLILGACSDDDDDVTMVPTTPESSETSETNVRITHASPDAPLVNVIVNESGDDTFEGVDYRQTSGLVSINPGSNSVVIQASLPGNDPVTLTTVNFDVASGETYDILAINTAESLEILELQDSGMPSDSLQSRTRVAHLSSVAPQVDVHVTTVDENISAATVVATLSFKEVSEPLEVVGGMYRVRITASGDLTPVYDSGEIPYLAPGDNTILAAVDNTGAGMSPVSLLAIDNIDATNTFDTIGGASLRVIHASPNAPAVDVIVNENTAAPAVSNFAYASAPTDFISPLVAGSYDINVVATSVTDLEQSAIDATVTLENGIPYSVVALNVLGSIEAIVLDETRRRIAGVAQVRIVHAVPATGAASVDIFVVPADTDITPDTVTPSFSEVPFKADTGYVQLAPNTYDIIVTAPGTKNVLFRADDITVAANGLYTAIASDGIQIDGDGAAVVDGDGNIVFDETTVDLILGDDFVTPPTF
ncbi:MAG: DUF4397 domain-containing protein [Pseudomonadota bacterium]